MKISKIKIQDSWLKTFIFSLLLLFYASLALHKISLPVYDDLPRQIKIGQEIMHGNFDILYKNTFSYTEPEQAFYNHHWFSGVIFYLLFGVLGWKGMIIFKVVILLLSFSILFFAVLKKSSFWAVACSSVPMLIIMAERTALRPEIFSYLFISIYIYVLFSFEDNPRTNKIFWLVPLQLLWVNMHVLFSIGIMLVAGFLFEKIIRNYHDLKNSFKKTISSNIVLRKLIIVFISLILASTMNPRGIDGIFYRYNAGFPIVVSEFQTLSEYQRNMAPWASITIVAFKASVFLLILSFIFLFYRRRKSLGKDTIPIFLILSSLAGIFIGFRILRGITLFALIFLIVFPVNMNELFYLIKDRYVSQREWFRYALICLFFAVLLPLFIPSVRNRISSYTEQGIGLERQSTESAKFFIDNNLHGPIFNDTDVGSYLIFYLYPKEKVFSDNRFGDAYSVEFAKNIYFPMLENEDAWLEYSGRYEFSTIFLYQYGGAGGVRDFIWRRLNDPAWVLVYVDRFNVIFVRNLPENKDLINKYAITRDNAPERLKKYIDSEEYLDIVTAADTLNLLGQNELASQLFLKVVYRWPEKGHIWLVMGEWELSKDQYRSHLLALMYIEKAISLGHKTSEAYTYLGIAYNKLGQKDKAVQALEEAIKKDPERRDAKDLLYQLAGRTTVE